MALARRRALGQARGVRLYHTTTSPFVRKVLVAAHELGLADRIETVFLRPVPTSADPTLSRANPLNKIPALELDDGSALYDSHVICEYLDAIRPDASKPGILPAAGPERFRVLRQEALCDGILDAAILVFYERASRPKELWWPAWLEGQSEKARQGVDALAAEVGDFGERVDLGTISAAITLGWLEFRAPLGPLREGRERLFAWYDAFRERPSMRATEPKL